MKKFLKSIIPVFALCFACLSFSTTAKAGDITSLTASASADSVTVEGKTEAGVYAVAITVYEKESKELVKYFTAQVDSATFSETFQLAYGSYEIRVADYDGGSFSSSLVTLEEKTVCVHEFEEKVTAATCTEKGKITLVCKKCGEVSSDAKEIAATGHKTVKTGEKAATCTEDGYTGDEVCQTCKTTVKKGTVVAKTGHSTKVEGAKAATCTEDGYTGDEVCQTCKETVKKGTAIDKLGHSYTSTLKAATCTEDGEKTYLCSTCGDTYKETLKAVGHIFQNGVCSVCQATDPAYKPETNVVIISKDEDKAVIEAVKTEMVNTLAASIKEVKEQLAAAGETVSTDKLIAIVKETLKKSESETVKKVVDSVSDKTLEKVITAIEEKKEISMVVVAQPVAAEELQKTAKADMDKIEGLLTGSGTVAQYLDLAVLIQAKDTAGNVETLGTVDEPTKKVTFTISIPESLKKKDRIFEIILVHNGGEAKKLTEVVDNQDGTLTFTTDKFSTYALAYTDPTPIPPNPTPNPSPNPSVQDSTTVTAEKISPKTGDTNKVAQWLVIFAAGMGAMLIALKKKQH